MNSFAGFNQYFFPLFLSCLLFGCFVTLFISGIFNLKLEAGKIALCTALTGISTFIPTEVALPGIALNVLLCFAVITLIAIICSYVLKLQFSKCLLSVVGIFILVMLLNIITEYMLGKVYHELIDMKVFLISQIIITMVMGVILSVIYIIKPISALPKPIRKKYSIAVVIVALLSLAIALVNFQAIFRYNIATDVDPTTLLVLFTLLAIYLVCLVLFSSSFMRLGLNRQELQQQKFYNQTLEYVTTDLRTQKHGFSNTLATIGGYIKLRQWEALETFYKESVEAYSSSSVSNAYKLMNVKNAGLAGLMLAKLGDPGVKGLDVTVNVEDEIREINMRINDLCEVAGILLDNAIEAASCSHGKYVGINLSETNAVTRITIENSSDEIPNLAHISQRGWSTKGEGRGLGLWIAEGIVGKYKNVTLNTTIGDHLVKQELSIINKHVK